MCGGRATGVRRVREAAARGAGSAAARLDGGGGGWGVIARDVGEDQTHVPAARHERVQQRNRSVAAAHLRVNSQLISHELPQRVVVLAHLVRLVGQQPLCAELGR